MHIVSVELENIKSHRRARFDLGRGTTAIMGENGAGKTTIIEAVAWTLFDLLDYRKEDFVTRGQKKGTAKVRFVSSLDEREYVVVRDTVSAYYVLDPALDTRIAKGREEVTRTLWQHLGVEPGTDLEALFRRAIGVPQGTFTAIFLETPAERKKAFDALLKVEEYREGAQKLLETSRYVEGRIQRVAIGIATAEGRLQRIDEVEAELASARQEADRLSCEVEALGAEARETRSAVAMLDELEIGITGLRSALQAAEAAKSRTELLLEQGRREFDAARAAAAQVGRVRPDNERHLKALGMLKELERERGERDRALAASREVETAEIRLRADRAKAEEDLARAHAAAGEMEELRAKAEEQERLESELRRLEKSLSLEKASREIVAKLDADILRLRDSYKKNQSELKEAESLAAGAGELDSLRKRDAEVTRELTRLRAQVEYDERFQSEVRNGLCPILSAKCLNLKEGETLEGFLKDQFMELRGRISGLEEEQGGLTASLKSAEGADLAAERVKALRGREAEIAAEGKRLAAEKETTVSGIPDGDALRKSIADTEAGLKALEDPRGRIRLLEREAGREAETRALLTEMERNFERLESDRKTAAERLAAFKDLDERWTGCAAERDATAEAHRTYIQNESAAGLLSECEARMLQAEESLAEASRSLSEAEAALKTRSAGYDAALHQRERAALIEAERRLAAARTSLEAIAAQRDRLAVESSKLSEMKQGLQAQFDERERLERVAEATDFIRETLKEAAPRVARNYVHHVSLEANQMFRDITGNSERTLKWAEDYAILLEEDGHDRPFGNLSGGEQMSAAMAVRLALLKQLSDIRIAFFDEPTANMDAARRERLAEQISEVTRKQTFDQLIVISHDDTFEHHVDNVITVGDDWESPATL